MNQNPEVGKEDMVIQAFPPPELADEHGLLAIGGDLEVESLLLAYRQGIFPWPLDDQHLTWFAPPLRAILFVDEFHCSKSFTKFLRQHQFSLRINFDFPAVVNACQALVNRKDQGATWITQEIEKAYMDLAEAGYAHSIECYSGSDLVGGLYGVSIGGMFAGESMFYRETNASKLCLFFLNSWLKKQGSTWFDCQVLTPLLGSFGARELPRSEFKALLSEAVERDLQIFPKESLQIGAWRGERL